MLHDFYTSSWKWLHKNYVIATSFTCNRSSMHMVYCWISNYKYATLFLCRMLGGLCSVISSFSYFWSPWSRGSLSSLLEFSLTWVYHKSNYSTDWYWVSSGSNHFLLHRLLWCGAWISIYYFYFAGRFEY